MPALTIRPARPEDAGLILALLTELAVFEKLAITITEAQIVRDFFGSRPLIEAEIAFAGETPVALISFYWIYATFRAARRLYLEDLFVRIDHRGKGYGKAILKHLAAKCLAAGGARLEWQVLDWNSPAITFYQGIGAHQHTGWDTYLLESEAMKALAEA